MEQQEPDTRQATSPVAGKRRGLRIFIIAAGLILTLGSAQWFGGYDLTKISSAVVRSGLARSIDEAQQAPQRQRRVPVRLAKAQRQTIPVKLSTIGRIQPVSSVAVGSQVSGIVSSVAVADGAKVKAGDVLVELDSKMIDAQIAQAKAMLVRDQANIDKAQRDLDRTAQLLKKQFAAQQTLDDQRTALDLAKAALAQDQAALDALQVQRGYYTIRAPFSGRVGVIGARVGSVVQASNPANPIATLNSIDSVYVNVGIPQARIAELASDRNQGSASISLVVPGQNKTLAASVSVIDNAADPATGLVPVLATIPNADGLLWPGEIVDVDVILKDEPDVITVPNIAVRTNQKGNFVFVVDNRGVARQRPVEVERTAGDISVISRGIEAGEQVVTDGQMQLADGSPVEVAKVGQGG